MAHFFDLGIGGILTFCVTRFWSRAAIVAGLEKDRVSISRQISIRDFAGDRDTFESTETAKELILKMKAMETSQKLYLEQAKCLNTEGDAEKVTRRSFIAMFTTSTLGLKILNTGMGPRKP